MKGLSHQWDELSSVKPKGKGEEGLYRLPAHLASGEKVLREAAAEPQPSWLSDAPVTELTWEWFSHFLLLMFSSDSRWDCLWWAVYLLRLRGCSYKHGQPQCTRSKEMELTMMSSGWVGAVSHASSAFSFNKLGTILKRHCNQASS